MLVIVIVMRAWFLGIAHNWYQPPPHQRGRFWSLFSLWFDLTPAFLLLWRLLVLWDCSFLWLALVSACDLPACYLCFAGYQFVPVSPPVSACDLHLVLYRFILFCWILLVFIFLFCVSSSPVFTCSVITVLHNKVKYKKIYNNDCDMRFYFKHVDVVETVTAWKYEKTNNNKKTGSKESFGSCI